MSQALDGKKVESVCLICHSSGSCINISGKDDKVSVFLIVHNSGSLSKLVARAMR